MSEPIDFSLLGMVPLRAGAALGQLSEFIGQHRVAEFAEDEMIFTFRDHPLLLASAAEPGNDAIVPYIMWADWLALPDADAKAMIAACGSVNSGRVLIRLTAEQWCARPSSDALADTAPAHIWLAWAGTGTSLTSDSVIIRPPESAPEKRFVFELLHEALLGAYADDLVDRGSLEAMLTADPLELDGCPLRSVIAVDEGEPVGHASWRLGQTDELTGEAYVDLVDISIRANARNRGLAHKLSKVAIDEAEQAGVPLIGNVVCQADGSHQPLMRGLLSAGWRVSHVNCVNSA